MKKQVIILVALCCLFTQTAQGDTFFQNGAPHETTDMMQTAIACRLPPLRNC